MWALDDVSHFTRRAIIYGILASGVLLVSPAFLEAYIMYKRTMDDRVKELKRQIVSEKLKDQLEADKKLH